MAENVSDLILHRLNMLGEKLDVRSNAYKDFHEKFRDWRNVQKAFLKNSVFAMGSAAGVSHRVDELADEIKAVKVRLDKLEENA